MKKCKYKRSHFSTQAAYEKFKKRNNEAAKRWLKKKGEEDPEFNERRILRQRLYARYYYHTNMHESFPEWLLREYGISNIKTMPIEVLRSLAAKS